LRPDEIILELDGGLLRKDHDTRVALLERHRRGSNTGSTGDEGEDIADRLGVHRGGELEAVVSAHGTKALIDNGVAIARQQYDLPARQIGEGDRALPGQGVPFRNEHGEPDGRHALTLAPRGGRGLPGDDRIEFVFREHRAQPPLINASQGHPDFWMPPREPGE
jgi:hypothetical protein